MQFTLFSGSPFDLGTPLTLPYVKIATSSDLRLVQLLDNVRLKYKENITFKTIGLEGYGSGVWII